MIKLPAREARSSQTPAMSAAHREATAASPSARPIFVKHATELGIDDARADAREIIDINRDRVEDLLDNQRSNLSEGWANKLRKALQASDWLVCVYTGGQSEFSSYEIGLFAHHGKEMRQPISLLPHGERSPRLVPLFRYSGEQACRRISVCAARRGRSLHRRA
jgi:hypothetical protein